MEIKKIKIDEIMQNKNLRMRDYSKDLGQLMESIKVSGLLQPIGVVKADKGKFEVLYGNRRFLACKKLGYSDIDCRIFESKDEKEFLEINLIENLHREEVTESELGQTFIALQALGLTESEISARVSLPISKVKRAISLYHDLPQEFRYVVKTIHSTGRSQKKGNIPSTMAHRILALKREFGLNAFDIKRLLEWVKSDKVNSVHLRGLIKMLHTGMTLNKAMESIKDYEVTTINLICNRESLKELTTKYKISKNNVVTEIISGDIPERLKILAFRSK